MIRRHAQVFQGATDKVSDLMATIFGHLSVALLAAGFLWAGAWIEQASPGTLAPIVGPQLASLAARLPSLGTGGWVLAIAATAVAWRTSRRLRKRFLQKDVRLPGTPERFV
jgi:hypothetical protein